MIGNFDLLVPKKEVNEEWMEKDILMLDEKDEVGDTHNGMSDDGGEVNIRFDWSSASGGDKKYLREKRAWGSNIDVVDIKMLEASIFGWADWSYKHDTRQAPLFHDMKCRLYVNRRYYKAVFDYLNECQEKTKLDPSATQVRNYPFATANEQRPSSTPLDSLAQVGSNVALSFAFSFLRRAWKSSEDSELCTSLLQDTLETFRASPPALMFDTAQVSSTWLHVLERSTDFLKSVASGDLTNPRESELSNAGSNVSKSAAAAIPVLDQHLAINLLLEIAFKKGNLPDLLEVLLYLLNLWETRRQNPDYRKNYQRTSAPLLHFLKQINMSISATDDADSKSDPNNILLSTLSFPDKEDVCIDLQQAVVITLSCLNRLARRYLNKNQSSALETGKNNIFERKFAGPARYKVFMWGASGGIYSCVELANIKFKQVECGALFNIALSEDGVVYVFGKFQTWSSASIMQSNPIDEKCAVVKFENPDSKFKKIAIHIKESYFLALTDDGTVYICGRVFDGPFKVISGKEFFAEPERIEKHLPWKRIGQVTDIACSLDYIAVVVRSGKVFIWNKKNRETANQPELLEDFAKCVVKQFSTCNVNDKFAAVLSADNEIVTFTVATGGVLTPEESVQMECDPEFAPPRIRRIRKIFAGDNFTAAITLRGELYMWGTGIDGLVTENTEPGDPPVSVKTNGKVKDLAWDGQALYIILENGKVCFWRKGSKDGIQPLNLLTNKNISGMSIGARFSTAWGIDESGESKLPATLPFILQPCEETLQSLDHFLSKVCVNFDTTWPPSQERECMAVATLNLLRLQLQESVFCGTKSSGQPNQGENSDKLLLNCQRRWPCIGSLKKSVVYLASTPGVVSSIQKSAQKCLSAGWRVLLQSPTERATALANVLESSLENEKPHQSQTFLIRVLIESLLVGNSVTDLVKQAALEICSNHKELDEEIEENSDSSDDDGDSLDDVPEETKLIDLIGLILKKFFRRTVALLKRDMSLETSRNKKEDRPILDFLIKFQTVATAHALDCKNELMSGCAFLLKRYALLICDHVVAILKEVQLVLTEAVNGNIDPRDENAKRFFYASNCIATDAGCTVLSPLITSLFLMQIEHGEENLVFCDAVDSGFVAEFASIKQLSKLLKALDQFNSFAPRCLNEEGYALSWRGTRYNCKAPDPFDVSEDSLPVIRSEDFENHNRDGGYWVIIDGMVYEAEQRTDAGLTNTTNDQAKVAHTLVGRYLSPENDVAVPLLSFHKESKVSDFAVVTRTLAVLIATHLARFQKHKIARSKLEVLPGNIRLLLKNGLEMNEIERCKNLDIPEMGDSKEFFEKTYELHPATKTFLLSLVDVRNSAKQSHGFKVPDENDDEKHAACNFLHKFDHICKKFGHFTSGQDDSKSPLDQFGQCYIACLLKHHDLADAALTCSLHKHSRLPHSISELCHTVGKAKFKLIHEHQLSGKSYSEICEPLIDRLHFLLIEVAPPTPSFIENRLEKIWRPKSRWKLAVEKLKKQKWKRSEEHHEEAGDSVPAKSKEGATQFEKVCKFSEKVFGKKDANGKQDGWKLIYTVISSQSDFEMLKRRLDGADSIKDDITMAVTDFAFNKDLNPNYLRDTMLYCRHSIANSIGALHEIVEIFSYDFLVPSTTYCLRTAWNGLFENIEDGLTAKALENSVIEEAEKKKKDEENDKDPDRYRYPIRQHNEFQKTVAKERSIPCDPILDLKYKLARNDLKNWSIEQFRLTACDLLGMVKSHKKHPNDILPISATSAIKSSMMDQQILLSQIRLLLMETRSLHFGWSDEDNNTTQCILHGCQAILEKVFIALIKYGVLDEPADKPEKDKGKILEYEGLDIASGGRKSGSAKSSATVPHPQLEIGPKLVESMQYSTKVVRGRDWKWQDQDGKPPGEGSVIGSPEDGWIRVMWPSGITNSYRMGKDDKYDVKLAHPEEFCADVEVGHTECGKMLPRSRYASRFSASTFSSAPLFPFISMQRACTCAIEIQCLSLARLKTLDEGAARIVSKRIFSVVKAGNNHILEKKGEWHSFEFIRALLTTNPKLTLFFATRDWIQLVRDYIGEDYCSVTEGNVGMQIQALRLLGVLLRSSRNENELEHRETYAKYLFKTLGLLTIGLKLQDPLQRPSKNAFLKRNPHLPGISRYADHAGTIAEAIIELLRNLHADVSWRDMIGKKICDHLQFVPSFMSLELKNTNRTDEEELSLAFGALAMISRVDKRIRIGGNIEHVPTERLSYWGKADSRGKGVMTEFKMKDDKEVIEGFYLHPNGNHEIYQTVPGDIQPCPPTLEFDWESLPWSTSLVSTCSELLKIALSPAEAIFSDLEIQGHLNNTATGTRRKTTAIFGFDSSRNWEDQIRLCQFQMYLYVLRSLPILLENQSVLRSVLKFLPPKMDEQPKIELDFDGNEEVPPRIPMSSSCPVFPCKSEESQLRKRASVGDLDAEREVNETTLLPIPNIIVHEAKVVVEASESEEDFLDSNDVTEATEEYCSEDEDESTENIKDVPTDELDDLPKNFKQNMLQDLLSLSVSPSRLKPQFKTLEMEEAVSSLLVFIESSTDQQDILNDYFKSLKIQSSVLEATGRVDFEESTDEKLDPKCGILKQNRSERRDRQIEQVRASEVPTHCSPSMRFHMLTRSGSEDSNRNSTIPRIPRWTPFPTVLFPSLKEQTWQGLIPAIDKRTLKDMGFKDKHINSAYRELSRRPLLPSQSDVAQGGFVPDMELVIAWLLENPAATCVTGTDSSPSEDDDDEEDIDGFEVIENDAFGRHQDLVPENVFHGLDEPGDSSYSSDSDSSSDDDAELPRPSLPMPEDTASSDPAFRTPADFASTDEYALYVRGIIKVGMMVKCCSSYEDVKEGDTGKVLKLDHDGLHDLNVHAAWISKGGTYWVRYVHIQLIRDNMRPLTPDEAQRLLSPIDCGDRVRVKASIITPKYKWGSVRHDSIGRVVNISGKDVVVNFDEQPHWTGLLSELEKVPVPHAGVTCDQCQASPIVGPRYKCTICYDYDMCVDCFGKKRHASPRHVFDMIEKPGASRVRTTASIPPAAVRQRTLSAMRTQDVAFYPAAASTRRSTISAERNIPGREDENLQGKAIKAEARSGCSYKQTTTWKKLVEKLEASSGKDTAECLLDGNDETFWQSTGSGGEHKLNLHMRPGAVVTSLVMQVDPLDRLSYMPSLVKIVLTNPDSTKIKSRAIRVQPSAKHVLLLRDCDKHYSQVTINIQKCKSFGIDCKVHSLFIKGYLLPPKRTSSVRGKINLVQKNVRKSNDDKIQQLFLASHSEKYIVTPFRERSKGRKHGCGLAMSTKVFAWGLNDKDQLGGPKGSKIKDPLFSENLSSLKISQIVGGSKSLFVVTQEGKVFSCGESTSGRLGLGLVSSNVSTPTFISHISSYFIRKVAIHSGGRHAMALASTGIVFSWGDGDDGKLGHSNRADCHKPRLIDALKDQHVVDIACGSSHSAAVTVTGRLYTWGQGNYGRLGHGDNNTLQKPKMVAALIGVHITKVACGSRDAQTLCLSKNEQVYSWGDGDFGKLGRGGSEGCSTPQVIEKLNGKGIVQIECGAQFSLALSESGKIWTWGKGDYFRLGQGHDGHVRRPTIISELQDKKIVKVSVGALHCLAVTDTGQVYSWGDNDHGQQGNGTTTVNRKPALVEMLSGLKITNIACGSSHSLAWSVTNETQDGHFDPLRFSAIEDRLGASYAPKADGDRNDPPKRSLLHLAGGFYRPKEEKKEKNADEKTAMPSLTKMVLAIYSKEGKKTAMKTIVQCLQILLARDLVTRSLIPAKYTKDGRNVGTFGSKVSPPGETHEPQRSQSPGPAKQEADDDSVPAIPDGAMSEVSGSISVLEHQQFEDEPGPSTSHTSQSSYPKHKPSDHAMASLIAETITSTEEITMPTPKKLNDPENEEEIQESCVQEKNVFGRVSDFEICSELGLHDARNLAEMLKLAVAGRLPIQGLVAVSHGLNHVVRSFPKVAKLLLSRCLCELEEVAEEAQSKCFEMKPVTQESTHPYTDDCEISGRVKIPGAKSIRIEFDGQCSTESRHDVLSFYTDGRKTLVTQLSGRDQSDWSKVINIEGDELTWTFKSDASVNGWGWKFTAFPLWSIGQSTEGDLANMSDGHILCKPLIAFVSQVLEMIFPPQQASPSREAIAELLETKAEIFQQLISSLTSCVHTSLIGPEIRIWAIQQHQNIHYHLLNLPLDNEVIEKIFKPLISILPNALSIQYKYEEPHVRMGIQLMHSAYLRELLTLASDLTLEQVTDKEGRLKLAPFATYFLTKKTLDSLVERRPFPIHFLQRISLKLDELIGDDFDDLPSFMPAHEDNSIFTQEMDEQLVNWMNSSPSDWTQSWGGSGHIFGWGHNHRGQLGGIDGAKVKVPALCSTLVSLQPISLAGGEQTLYAITSDGKVYATGYGASGRLGIGSSDSIALPTLLESIRHVHITKVSVNSGGKHILALSADGEVYSWGEGGDGKLGHGSRTSCDRPRVIDSLRGIEIIDISAGGAHSAAISQNGLLYTWGKGRYGRLGHKDSEDRLKPKLVEALEPYHVHCVACGSGDAQTLCVTDSARRDSGIESEGTLVWSWGDGDYGKLGRGGSEMSKVPMQIDGLKNKHIIMVKCGSQFSLALSKSGAVYTWGKGDYYRLGHGMDQHVRFPKLVDDLRGKKVIDVSTGSLHCIVCTEDGDVYAWGDNDEGQIGDGTTQAAKRLTMITSLSDQGVNRVACGSAHSIAWSTGSMRSRRTGKQSRLPALVPLKFNLLQATPIPVLRNRLVLLNQFSELFCNCNSMLPLLDKSWRGSPCSTMISQFASNFEPILSSPRFPDAVRGLLINSGKECFFRKIVQMTMVRDKQHGPVIELNRIEVKEFKKAGVPLTGLDFLKAVFPQACLSIEKLLPDSVLLPHRVWKVKFVGESVDDCGGGYSESIAEMCDELENGSVPLLTQTPNGRDEAGANRDCFLLLPPEKDPDTSFSLNSTIYRMFKFLGILIGVAIRTGSPLSLNLANPVWKMLSGQEQCLTDISEVDKDFLPKLMFIRDADADELDSMNLPFTIQAASGKEVALSRLYSTVTVRNRNEYIRQAIQFRLHEFNHLINFVRDGMACVVPLPLISLFTAQELETMVCGSPDIPLSLLKSVASFKGTSSDDNLQTWFWEIMESMTNEEKSLFLRFVWGRTRLPRTIADFRGRDFAIQVLDKYNPPDHYLPESYTCFFLLKLPRYSSKAIMDEKLKYAIYFCKSIDTDDYARMAMNGEDDDEDLEDLIANNNNALEVLTARTTEATNMRATVERLRSQVRTTHLNLLSRYSSNVSRYLRRRRRTFDLDSNQDDDSSTSGPDSNSDSDPDSVYIM